MRDKGTDGVWLAAARDASGALLVIAFLALGWRGCMAQRAKSSGARRNGVAMVGDGQGINLSPGESGPPQPGQHSSLSDSETAASSAPSSPPESVVARMPPARAGAETGGGPGGVYSQPFTLEGLPTPEECVLATTLDLWDSEAMKTLTLAEVRALLQPGGGDPKTRDSESPCLAAYDLTGDGLLLDRIGGLPTEEDVIDALDHPEVQDALYRFLVADGISLEFELNPIRTPEMERALENALRARDAAQDGLYAALDEASGYHNWRLLGTLWREMDQR